MNGPVYALAVLPEAEGGDVIVGGRFTMAGGIAANNIARYDPETNTWSAMGEGFALPSTAWNVSALAVIRTAAGVELVAGMARGITGGAAERHMARFSFATGDWTPMMMPFLTASVDCMLVLPDGDLLAGGYFSPPQPPSVGRILRYHVATDTWSSLPGSANRTIYAMAGGGERALVVSGPFGRLDTALGGIVRRDTVTGAWSGFDPRPNNWVYAVAMAENGDMFAGGIFAGVGSASVPGVVHFRAQNGTWAPLGRGVSGSVYALRMLSDGDVLVGGSFSLNSGQLSNSVARYDLVSQRWTAMARGVEGGAVRAVVDLPGGDVIVAGSFGWAGGQPASRIARFTFNTGPLICPADFDCSGAASVEDVYAYVGEFLGRSPRADLNGDGVVSVQDLLDFVRAYFEGCP